MSGLIEPGIEHVTKALACLSPSYLLDMDNNLRSLLVMLKEL